MKLLIENGADVNKSSTWFGVPLKLAIIKADYDKVKLLIENGANLLEKEGNSYLNYYLNFTKNPNIEIVKLLEIQDNNEINQDNLNQLEQKIKDTKNKFKENKDII